MRAQGPATRFQWGYNYLVGMLEMTPEDMQGIERAGLAVLGELDGPPDAFYQRTRMRLEQLDTKLLEWGQAGDAAKVVETLRARTGDLHEAAGRIRGGQLREIPRSRGMSRGTHVRLVRR